MPLPQLAVYRVTVLIGIGLLTNLWWTYQKHSNHERYEEGVGLYWHFVDMVWVFLYPLFYLVGDS